MKKNNFFITFLFLTVSLSCQAMETPKKTSRTKQKKMTTPKKIIRTPSFDELAKEINKSIEQVDNSSKILVILNIDALFNNIPLWTMQNIIKQKYAKNKTALKKFYSIIDTNFKPPLADDRIPLYIANLQKTPNVKVIGLTESNFGARPFNKSYEDAIIETLESHDLNFSEAFPRHGDYMLYNCVIKKDGTGFFEAIPIPNDFFPINRYYNTKLSFLFKQGILFTNGFSKNCILEEFLNRIKKTDNWKPDGVIFIDDVEEKSLTLIKKLLADNDIPHKLIHDTRIENEKERIRKSKTAQRKANTEARNYIKEIFIRYKKQKPTKA